MLDNNFKIMDSVINGDAVAGDKNVTINIYNQSEDKSVTNIVKDRIKELTEKSKNTILNFKELNPYLDLKILQEEKLTNFIITPKGQKEVEIGDLTVMNQGAEKVKNFFENGIDVTLEKDEFYFKSQIKGLPDFAELINKQLFLKSNIKKITHQVKMKLLADDKKTIYEILTNLHVLNAGTKRLNILITGLEFIGEFKFYINHESKNMDDVKMLLSYDTNNIDYLIKTIDFFIFLSKKPVIEIFSLEFNISFFSINTINYVDKFELQQVKEFLIKYLNVIKHFNILPVQLYKLNSNDKLFIEITSAYLNKESFAIENRPLKIKGVSDLFYESFKKNNINHNLDLTLDMSLVFSILNKQISLGDNEIVLIKPNIVKLDEDFAYEISYDKMIYNFSKK